MDGQTTLGWEEKEINKMKYIKEEKSGRQRPLWEEEQRGHYLFKSIDKKTKSQDLNEIEKKQFE